MPAPCPYQQNLTHLAKAHITIWCFGPPTLGKHGGPSTSANNPQWIGLAGNLNKKSVDVGHVPIKGMQICCTRSVWSALPRVLGRVALAANSCTGAACASPQGAWPSTAPQGTLLGKQRLTGPWGSGLGGLPGGGGKGGAPGSPLFCALGTAT